METALSRYLVEVDYRLVPRALRPACHPCEDGVKADYGLMRKAFETDDALDEFITTLAALPFPTLSRPGHPVRLQTPHSAD